LQMYKNSASPSMTSKLQAVCVVWFSDSAYQHFARRPSSHSP
jgi:hypothetical protein